MLKQVNPAERPLIVSPGSELFNAYQMGEIDQPTWFDFSAMRIQERCHNEEPMSYTPMPDFLKRYCHGRLDNDHLPYDRDMAVRLNNWLMGVQKAHDQNQALLDDFRWAAGRLEANPQMKHLAQKLRTTIERFSLRPFPGEDCTLVLETKKRDAIARERRG